MIKYRRQKEGKSRFIKRTIPTPETDRDQSDLYFPFT